jgi:hypothetical protein
VERALAIALVCARHLGRYRWDGTLHTGPVIAAAAWDRFSCLGPDGFSCLAPGGAAGSWVCRMRGGAQISRLSHRLWPMLHR